MAERIAIVGSRDFTNLSAVVEFVDRLPRTAVVVSGGARGVDRTAVAAARARGMQTVVYPADWQTHGKAAGFLRNRTIVANADRVVAFWDGTSRGAAHTMSLTIEAGKPLEVIRG